MQIEMKRVGNKEQTGQMWTLDLGKETVVLTDHEGKVAIEFPAAEATGRFQFPSFSQSIKWFGVANDQGIWTFDVPKVDLTLIKGYVDRSIVTAGPEAIAGVRASAIRTMLIGAACTAGGIVITVGSYAAAAQKPEGGKYTITHGLIIVGIIMFVKGVYGWFQYTRLQGLAGATGEE
jgi:hypothetical protein